MVSEEQALADNLLHLRTFDPKRLRAPLEVLRGQIRSWISVQPLDLGRAHPPTLAREVFDVQDVLLFSDEFVSAGRDLVMPFQGDARVRVVLGETLMPDGATDLTERQEKWLVVHVEGTAWFEMPERFLRPAANASDVADMFEEARLIEFQPRITAIWGL